MTPSAGQGRAGRIYHLMPHDEWQADQSEARPVAWAQYERHGFVHCCTREQILEVATWWLAGDAALVALEIASGDAGDVRFERADLGREYPHVYNPIPRAALAGAHKLPEVDGALVLPDALASPPPEFLVIGRLGGREVGARWSAAALVDGDDDLVARALEKVEKGENVPQFPEVVRPASTATPYDAFCLLAATLDEVVQYRGDGFTTQDG